MHNWTTKKGTAAMKDSDIFKNEIHPELYASRRNGIRKRKILDFIGAIIIIALVFGLFAVMEIAYGIW